MSNQLLSTATTNSQMQSVRPKWMKELHKYPQKINTEAEPNTHGKLTVGQKLKKEPQTGFTLFCFSKCL